MRTAFAFVALLAAAGCAAPVDQHGTTAALSTGSEAAPPSAPGSLPSSGMSGGNAAAPVTAIGCSAILDWVGPPVDLDAAWPGRTGPFAYGESPRPRLGVAHGAANLTAPVWRISRPVPGTSLRVVLVAQEALRTVRGDDYETSVRDADTMRAAVDGQDDGSHLAAVRDTLRGLLSSWTTLDADGTQRAVENATTVPVSEGNPPGYASGWSAPAMLRGDALTSLGAWQEVGSWPSAYADWLSEWNGTPMWNASAGPDTVGLGADVLAVQRSGLRSPGDLGVYAHVATGGHAVAGLETWLPRTHIVSADDARLAINAAVRAGDLAVPELPAFGWSSCHTIPYDPGATP